MRYYFIVPDTIFMLLKNTFAKFKQHETLGTGFPTPYYMQYLYLTIGIHTLGGFFQMFFQGAQSHRQ